VGKELLVALAETAVAVGMAMLGTFAVAEEEPSAALAQTGQGSVLGDTETEAPGLAVELAERLRAEVAEAVGGKDEVVADIDVAVVLDGKAVAARLAEGAEGSGLPAPLGKGVVEKLHVDASHVGAHPLVIDVAEELPEVGGGDGVGGEVAVGCLHDGQELDEGGEVAQETIDLGSASGRMGVDGAEYVEIDAARGHELGGAEHAVEGGASAAVAPVGVVEVAGTVEGEPDKEVVVVEETAPFGGDERAVGLQGVLNLFVPAVLLLKSYGLAVEVDAGDERLAAMPAEGDDGCLEARARHKVPPC